MKKKVLISVSAGFLTTVGLIILSSILLDYFLKCYRIYAFGVGNQLAWTAYGKYILLSIFLLLLSCLLLIGTIVFFFFINRADLSELTKSTLQARRERKAARLEAEKQRKIEEAKKTLAELDDKEKVSE